MRIEAKLTKDFSIDVMFFGSPSSGAQLSVLYYGIIRAMKEHHKDEFEFAMKKFLSEEVDEILRGEENDKSNS